MKFDFGKNDLHIKKFEDKRERKLYGKDIKNMKDKDLYIKSCEIWSIKNTRFVFEEKNLNYKSFKNLGSWSRSNADQFRNNSASLICQYQVIII